ncbi:MAG: hypothetical protein GY925_02550 [Actinomycetia bacterium]|nr:hypothetical protein [Actinomycetes bacterium]
MADDLKDRLNERYGTNNLDDLIAALETDREANHVAKGEALGVVTTLTEMVAVAVTRYRALERDLQRLRAAIDESLSGADNE